MLRTDSCFETLGEARELTRAFFRKDFAFEVRAAGVFLPECTGLWSLKHRAGPPLAS